MGTKRVILMVAAACTALSACGGGVPKRLDAGNYARPIGTAPVTANPTPYSTALNCLASYARQNRVAAPRIAVGRIADYTGKEESDGSGRKVTQGASLMAMTAFAKAGMPMVERFDTSVSELELKYANNKLISDRPAPTPDAPADYRKIVAGQVAGSDFYLVGGVTELNYNIHSAGADLYGGDIDTDGLKANFKRRLFVMNIAMDLRLINSRTLVVEDVISYQKQVIGREVSVGIFAFANNNLFDLSGGKGALEPVQLAVRSLIERSVVEMSANLYGMPGPQSCLQSDPFGADTVGVTGAFTPAYNNLGSNNAQTREDPSRWNDRSDPSVRRGRY
ncbi:holdfast anchoring protein HfaB [Caulobacter endophyticus]|uniref:Transcriptional regulator n=1 Tax=Caulobacter endophyticus TaxID=2172652 RepID=A0A2T9KD09_9CAUL|nr:holdfast anchoring protein HfaB [Caulobacter endophyticus]PVM93851.1 transcriptional regulator [Caulobacter endophyticus]